MKEYTYEGKDEQELLTKGLEELNLNEGEYFSFSTKTKGGLLKKEVVTVHIIKRDDLIEYVKDFLKTVTSGMELEVEFESKIREDQIIIKMYSDNNNILIGHEGKTLKALTYIVKQLVYNKVGVYPHILLDVENYKEKQEKRLIRLAKNIAREVSKTKNEVVLENMNSYERRIIHNTLGEYKNVYTVSEGEEPNRHVIVKPKED